MHLFSHQHDDDHADRVIAFPSRGLETAERPARRARTARPRRPRRRRQNTPWLQRNALSVAAVSVLVAVLGLGFGLAQFMARSQPAPAFLAVSPDQAPAAVPTPAVIATPEATLATAAPVPDGSRAIQTSATVLQPNYTVQSGDTLGRIAAHFNTSVERIQAFNNLPDPRSLRVGTKLAIPPPF